MTAHSSAEGRRLLTEAFHAALESVEAGKAVRRAFTEEAATAQSSTRRRPCHLIALGKAAAPMARAAAESLGPRVASSLTVTKFGHARGGVPGELVEAGHPLPDGKSLEAGRLIHNRVASIPANQDLLFLLSGGASALAVLPTAGLDLADLISTNELLLACGAPIHEMNAIRKRLSRISGGRLAGLCPANRIDVWVVSDVVGDDLAVIGSGPFAPDDSDFAIAAAVADRRSLWPLLPRAVADILREGAGQPDTEASGSRQSIRGGVHHRVVASSADALGAAAQFLAGAGIRPVVVSTRLCGEAAQVGKAWVQLASCVRSKEAVVLLAGGETTVTFEHAGSGGRNQELALAAAIALDSMGSSASDLAVLAAGTDGSDGPTAAAGGCVDGQTAAAGRGAGLDPRRALEAHDSNPFLKAAGALIETGPTGTNVMDLTLAWVPGISSRSGRGD